LTRLGFVHRGIVSPKMGFAGHLLWALAAVAIPTLVRLAVSPFVDDLPYLTFFPAVLVATVFLGARWGVIVLVACAFTGDYVFIRPVHGLPFATHRTVAAILFLMSAGMIVAAAATLRRTVRELDANSKREATLNAELQHRVKNNLAVVQALARQTARTSPDPAEFNKAFFARLMALAKANDILSTGQWEECRLPHLAKAALKPFDRTGAVRLAGPACIVPAITCVPLVLALHELGTNASKYGALAVATGQVILAWDVVDGAALFRWEETGGPPVEPPKRRGLGSRLLSKQAGLESVTLEFRPEGVACQITVNNAKLAAA
jgi:two-component sensor histidine kinase